MSTQVNGRKKFKLGETILPACIVQNFFYQWLAPDFLPIQYVMYVIGMVLFSFGADCFIHSDLGTDPLDSFALGFTYHVPGLTVGQAQIIFAVFCLLIWAVWNKKLPIVSPIFTFGICGTLIDVWIGTKYLEDGTVDEVATIRHGENAAAGVKATPEGLLVFGVFMCTVGSAFIIMSGIGVRSMDLVALTICARCKCRCLPEYIPGTKIALFLGGKLPFWFPKALWEIALTVGGIALGGPFGPGTFAFLCCVGFLIGPCMWVIEHFFPVFPNYGVNDYGTTEGMDSNPTQVEMTEVDQAKSKTDSSNTSTKLESHVVDVPVGNVKKTYAVGSFQEFLQVEFNIDYDTEFHRLKTEQQELAQQQFKNRLNKGAEI